MSLCDLASGFGAARWLTCLLSNAVCASLETLHTKCVQCLSVGLMAVDGVQRQSCSGLIHYGQRQSTVTRHAIIFLGPFWSALKITCSRANWPKKTHRVILSCLWIFSGCCSGNPLETKYISGPMWCVCTDQFTVILCRSLRLWGVTHFPSFILYAQKVLCQVLYNITPHNSLLTA